MNRLQILSGTDKGLLACYLPFADPAYSREMVKIYQDCGVDVAEVGIPCQNPYADGPTVADSMRRAFRADPGLTRLPDLLAEIRRSSNIATILMGYNLFADKRVCFSQIAEYVDGVLSLPAQGEEGSDRTAWFSEKDNIYRIACISNTLPPESLERVRTAGGYIMLLAREGKTGVSASIGDSSRQIRQIRMSGTQVPILLGFGISNKDHVRRALDMGADGVVIGSACLEMIQSGGLPALTRFLTEIRGVLNAK